MPNVITRCAAISACGNGQQSQQALKLFGAMQRPAIVPSEFIYSTAITVCEEGPAEPAGIGAPRVERELGGLGVTVGLWWCKPWVFRGTHASDGIGQVLSVARCAA